MRRILIGVLLATSGCSSTHPLIEDAGADTPTDADVLTEGDRSIIEFLTATCSAWASCPTGLSDGYDMVYAHGAEQCMTEWGDPFIEYLREDLRDGRLVIDTGELRRCMDVLATENCPSQRLATTDWWFRSQCDLSVVFRTRPGLELGAHCGLDEELGCNDGLQCSAVDCPLRCVDVIDLGDKCGVGVYCDPPWRCGSSGRCEIVPTREVGEGDECGYDGLPEGDRGCARGLFCSRPPMSGRATCVQVPRAGQECPDGVCSVGSFCQMDAAGVARCAVGPLSLGEACSGEFDTDPCDRSGGLVCMEGRCVRAGLAEGEPCVARCNDGLYCSWTTQRCTSPREYFTVPDGAACEFSNDCLSHWCDRRTEPYTCRPRDTPCE